MFDFSTEEVITMIEVLVEKCEDLFNILHWTLGGCSSQTENIFASNRFKLSAMKAVSVSSYAVSVIAELLGPDKALIWF
jgi:hypothetical protein